VKRYPLQNLRDNFFRTTSRDKAHKYRRNRTMSRPAIVAIDEYCF
jgi:hypothetical protein